MLFFYLFLQTFDNGCGCIHTNITHDQDFFQFFIELIINGRKAFEYTIDTLNNVISCLGKPCFQSGEEAHFLLGFFFLRCFFFDRFLNGFFSCFLDCLFSCFLNCFFSCFLDCLFSCFLNYFLSYFFNCFPSCFLDCFFNRLHNSFCNCCIHFICCFCNCFDNFCHSLSHCFFSNCFCCLNSFCLNSCCHNFRRFCSIFHRFFYDFTCSSFFCLFFFIFLPKIPKCHILPITCLSLIGKVFIDQVYGNKC